MKSVRSYSNGLYNFFSNQNPEVLTKFLSKNSLFLTPKDLVFDDFDFHHGKG